MKEWRSSNAIAVISPQDNEGREIPLIRCTPEVRETISRIVQVKKKPNTNELKRAKFLIYSICCINSSYRSGIVQRNTILGQTTARHSLRRSLRLLALTFRSPSMRAGSATLSTMSPLPPTTSIPASLRATPTPRTMPRRSPFSGKPTRSWTCGTTRTGTRDISKKNGKKLCFKFTCGHPRPGSPFLNFLRVLKRKKLETCLSFGKPCALP